MFLFKLHRNFCSFVESWPWGSKSRIRKERDATEPFSGRLGHCRVATFCRNLCFLLVSPQSILSVIFLNFGVSLGDKGEWKKTEMFVLNWWCNWKSWFHLESLVSELLSICPQLCWVAATWRPFYKSGIKKAQTSSEVGAEQFYHKLLGALPADKPPRPFKTFLPTEGSLLSWLSACLLNERQKRKQLVLPKLVLLIEIGYHHWSDSSPRSSLG